MTHPAHADGRWQFWIDRGGTFTDIVARRPDGTLATHKLLSENPEQYADAAIAGIRQLLAVGVDSPLPVAAIEAVKMGTTVATNALLERKGEPTVLVISRGFRDALRIAYQNRPRLFDRHIVLPELLYATVIEADEREVAYAVANVVAFGLFGMLTYPFLAHALLGHSETIGLFLGTVLLVFALVPARTVIADSRWMLIYYRQYGNQLNANNRTIDVRLGDAPVELDVQGVLQVTGNYGITKAGQGRFIDEQDHLAFSTLDLLNCSFQALFKLTPET